MSIAADHLTTGMLESKNTDSTYGCLCTSIVRQLFANGDKLTLTVAGVVMAPATQKGRIMTNKAYKELNVIKEELLNIVHNKNCEYKTSFPVPDFYDRFACDCHKESLRLHHAVAYLIATSISETIAILHVSLSDETRLRRYQEKTSYIEALIDSVSHVEDYDRQASKVYNIASHTLSHLEDMATEIHGNAFRLFTYKETDDSQVNFREFTPTSEI